MIESSMDKGLPIINTGNAKPDTDFLNNDSTEFSDVKVWFKAARVEDFPKDGGACVKYKGLQIAVFNFTRRNEWYACQNMCPHKMQMVLSRGMIGSHQGEPKVACPFHKRTFSLKTGECLNTDECAITVYPVRIENGFVHIGLSA